MVAEVAGDKRITVGGDKGYDTKNFAEELRGLEATLQVSQNVTRKAVQP
jgi:hypothetical protein